MADHNPYEIYLGPEETETWWTLYNGVKVAGPFATANEAIAGAKRHTMQLDMADIMAEYEVNRIVR